MQFKHRCLQHKMRISKQKYVKQKQREREKERERERERERESVRAVSYTHLDVYKRQIVYMRVYDN